jgi:hypothetical protein
MAGYVLPPWPPAKERKAALVAEQEAAEQEAAEKQRTEGASSASS